MGSSAHVRPVILPCFHSSFHPPERRVELIAVPVILSSLHRCTHGGPIEEIFSAALPYISGSEPYHLSRRSSVTVELTQRSARRGKKNKKKTSMGTQPPPPIYFFFLNECAPVTRTFLLAPPFSSLPLLRV